MLGPTPAVHLTVMSANKELTEHRLKNNKSVILESFACSLMSGGGAEIWAFHLNYKPDFYPIEKLASIDN